MRNEETFHIEDCAQVSWQYRLHLICIVKSWIVEWCNLLFIVQSWYLRYLVRVRKTKLTTFNIPNGLFVVEKVPTILTLNNSFSWPNSESPSQPRFTFLKAQFLVKSCSWQFLYILFTVETITSKSKNSYCIANLPYSTLNNPVDTAGAHVKRSGRIRENVQHFRVLHNTFM